MEKKLEQIKNRLLEIPEWRMEKDIFNGIRLVMELPEDAKCKNCGELVNPDGWALHEPLSGYTMNIKKALERSKATSESKSQLHS